METGVRMLPFERSMINEGVDLFMDTFSREPWNDVYQSKAQVVSFFENYMNDSYFIGYVLKLGDEIAALSIGAKKPWINGMEYYIDQFCISEKYQRQGLGSEFLRLIESDIREQGISSILLTTDRGFPSEKFYKKNGFKELEDMIFLAK